MKALETGFDIVVTLVKEGPAAAWEKIKEQLSNLKEMVMEQVMTFVRDKIVAGRDHEARDQPQPGRRVHPGDHRDLQHRDVRGRAAARRSARSSPSFIDSISAIAAGAIGAAANRVEQTMAGLLTLVISFLARLVGLGKVTDAVLNIVKKIRAPIDKALDKVVEWIVNTAKKLGRIVAQAGVPADPVKRAQLGVDAAVAAVNALKGNAVGAALITPVLAAIKVRYGFKTLQAKAEGGSWWIEGEINPAKKKKTNKQAAAPGATAVRKSAKDRSRARTRGGSPACSSTTDKVA